MVFVDSATLVLLIAVGPSIVQVLGELCVPGNRLSAATPREPHFAVNCTPLGWFPMSIL
jgi:hypothetical protein